MVDEAATGALTITGATGTGPASWEQVGADIDAEAAGDEFGTSVSLSADGSTVAIGAPYSDGNGSGSGHVRIYQLNSSTNAWEQVGADIDGEAARDWAGTSVSLSADGSSVAIGAGGNDGNGNDSGHVRIYQHNGSSNVWEQVGADIDGEAANDASGTSVSLSADGSSVAIGAIRNDGNGDYSGHVRIYQLNSSTNAWEQIGADIDGEAIDDFSGVSVSLSADGSTVAIGAPYSDGNGSGSGHVRIYQRNTNGNWEKVGADIDGEAAGDNSGASVSLSADGSSVAIGAYLNDGNGYRAGHVRIYERKSNGNWEQVGADIDGEESGDESGTSVSISADGSIIAIGATDNGSNGISSGHVRIYERKSNGYWEQVGADIDGEAAYDASGTSVSLSADGSTVAIGASSNDGNGDNAGHVRIYQRNAPTQPQQGDILSANLADVHDADGTIQSTTYQWQSSSDNGLSWSDLSETSQQLDTSAQSLVGQDVRVIATTTDALGGTTSFISAAHTIANVDDEATGLLTIIGVVEEGSSLTAWLNAEDPDVAITHANYQWQETSNNGLTWIDLQGYTKTKQLRIPADQSWVGKTIRVTATTTDALGGTSTFSSAAQTIANADDAATGILSITGATGPGPASWLQVGTDIDGEAYSDRSGRGVSLSADGSTVAIGAYLNNGNGSSSGHVRIYQRNSTGNWQQVGTDIDGEAAGDYSGARVSLSADGSSVAIGAYLNDGNGYRAGHVRIYERKSNGNWEQVGADIDGEAAGDYSGASVSLSADGSTVAIGAYKNDGNGTDSGHVRIYERKSNDNWEQVGAGINGEVPGDGSGSSVSLSADGSIIAIGATDNGSNGIRSGHVRIYERKSNGYWEQVGADIDGEAAYDESGGSVSLSADGSTVAIGARRNSGNGSRSGHVRIYQRNGATYPWEQWEQVGADIDGEAAYDASGTSVSLSADGSTVAIGASSNDGNGDNAGHVRIYQFNAIASTWEQVGADIDGENSGDDFGTSVSLSADGSTVAIGAPYSDGNGSGSGHVRIYELNATTQAQQGDILSANFSNVQDADGAIQSTIYQWQSSSDNGLSWSDLSGETNRQLDTSAQSLVGQDVRVTATTTDALGGSTSFTSTVRTIANVDEAAAATLTISGIAEEGGTLTASLNVVDADGSIQSIGYQWQSSSDNGLSWSDLSETNQQLNTSAQSLVGQDVRVIATTTDAFGGSTSFTSTSRTIAADTSAPIFTSTGTATAIDENSGAGQIIYAAVARDNSSIAYSLRDNNDDDAASFSIDAATGKVSLNEDPDYETRSVYSFTVLAIDNAGNSSEQSISLSVKDVSEWPAIQSINTVRAKKKVATFSLRKPLAVEEQKLDAVIVGTNKKDKISGSAKNEILAGFKGKDILKGGGGADGFLFDKPTGFGKRKMDKIVDFDSAEQDKILVDKKAFGLRRRLKFKSVNSRRQLNKFARKKFDFLYENKTGLLYFNENGKRPGFGGGGMFAQLQGKPDLFVDDFRIV